MEKFLQGTGGLQNRELLMIHYLQQANYIPALQLNRTLKMNLVVCLETATVLQLLKLDFFDEEDAFFFMFFNI